MEFKVGDLVIAKDGAPYFVTNKSLEYPMVVEGFTTANPCDIIVRIDSREIDNLNDGSIEGLYPVESKYFELAQSSINEQKIRRLLGVE